MLVPNRHGSSDSYRYGFQGQEKDDELKGEGNSLNYTFRMHDPRIGRFFTKDPLESKYPELSPYQFGGNRVVDRVELEGLESASDDQMMDRWQKEHVKTGRMTSEQVAAIQKNQTFISTIALAAYVDIVLTRGYISRALIGGGLLESLNETERSYEAEAKGNYGEAHRRKQNAGESSKIVIYGLAAEGIGYGIGKISKAVKVPKSSVNVKAGSVKFDAEAGDALFELGTYPSYTSIKNGVGKIRIGYAKSLAKENIKLVEETFKANGASSLEIMTGTVKPEIKNLFEKLIKAGKNFQGYKIEKTSLNALNDFKLTKKL